MSERTLSYNASTGSNTAASGAGPATAVTGTSAAYSGDGAGGGTQTVITFTNSPDLSAVTTDHILYLNTSAGETYLFEITAVNDGADTVTVDVAPDTAINSGSAVSYAIGGKRAGPRRSGTELDFAMARSGWVYSLDNGTYDITLDAASGTLDCPSDTALARIYRVEASSMPVDADAAAVIFTFNLSTMDGSGEQINLNGHWIFAGIQFLPDATAGSGTNIPMQVDVLTTYRCNFDCTQLTSGYWRGIATAACLYFETTFDGDIRNLVGNGNADFCMMHCSVRGPAQPVPEGQQNKVLLFNTFIDSPEIVLREHSGGLTIFYGNTMFGSNGSEDQLDLQGAGQYTAGQVLIMNNAFIDSGGYAITGASNWAGQGYDCWHATPEYLRDYNHFDGAVSGNYNPTTSATANQGSGDPVFVSETPGSTDLRPDTGSPLISGSGDVGKNPDIVGDS